MKDGPTDCASAAAEARSIGKRQNGDDLARQRRSCCMRGLAGACAGSMRAGGYYLLHYILMSLFGMQEQGLPIRYGHQ